MVVCIMNVHRTLTNTCPGRASSRSQSDLDCGFGEVREKSTLVGVSGEETCVPAVAADQHMCVIRLTWRCISYAALSQSTCGLMC